MGSVVECVWTGSEKKQSKSMLWICSVKKQYNKKTRQYLHRMCKGLKNGLLQSVTFSTK